MNSKTSFSKGLFKNEIKRFKWMGIAYFVFLFFLIPLRIIMIYNSNNNYLRNLGRIFNFRNELLILSMVVVPILLGLLIFRYLQVNKRSDFVHSLPIKREGIYLTNITIGVLVLSLPVILISIISILFRYTFNLEAYITLKSIFSWTGITILINLTIFSITVFTGMITGITTLHGVLSFAFIFVPSILSMLVFSNLEKLLYGFNMSNINDEVILKLSPILMIITTKINSALSIEIISYIIFTIILLVISGYLYKRRKLEYATNSFSFNWVKPIFKYGITFSAMTLGGLYFTEIQRDNTFWLILGYLVGSLIGYIISEMIIRKSFTILKYMKGYIIYLIIITLLLIGIKIDITGFEKYVPNIDKIKSVHIGESLYNYDYSYFKNEVIDDFGLTDENNKKLITELHKEIIRNKDTNSRDLNIRRMNIVYNFKNGNKVVRSYNINYDRYKKYLKPIYETAEHKKYYNNLYKPLFVVEEQKIDKITINTVNSINKRILITNPDEIKEVVKMLKEDVFDETYEEITDNILPWSNIEFLQSDNKRYIIYFRKSFEKFEEWLKERGYYENSRIMPNDISYVRVYKVSDLQKSNNDDIEIEKPTIDYRNQENIKKLEIIDKDKIEYLLRITKESWLDRSYIVEYYDNYKNIIFSGTLDEFIPDYIIEYFSK